MHDDATGDRGARQQSYRLGAYKPSEIAQRIEEAGAGKVRLGSVQMATLSPLAGAFIAFAALGYEHSVANMYLIPVGMLEGAQGGIMGLLGNLVPVTLGNVIGGAGGVALTYWAAYRRS